MKCHEHAGIDSTGKCIVCGKQVCQDCIATSDGKIVCKSCDANVTGVAGYLIGNNRTVNIEFFPGKSPKDLKSKYS